MRFFLMLPNCMRIPAVTQDWEHGLSRQDLVMIARTAEDLGFSAVTVPEHYLTPASQVAVSGNHYFHALTALSYIAGATSRIKLRSSISILPFQHPVLFAKAVATLDWFSGGRAMAGVGLGWMPEEFAAFGIPMSERGRIADEFLGAILELWQSDAPHFDGKYVSFSDVVFGPKPVQEPRPPLWIAGDADATLRRAARFGDGWQPWQTKEEDLPARLEFLRAQPGFDGRPFSVSWSLQSRDVGTRHEHLNEGTDVGRASQQLVEKFEWLASIGVTDIRMPVPYRVSCLEEYVEHMHWFADEVMSKIASP